MQVGRGRFKGTIEKYDKAAKTSTYSVFLKIKTNFLLITKLQNKATTICLPFEQA